MLSSVREEEEERCTGEQRQISGARARGGTVLERNLYYVDGWMDKGEGRKNEGTTKYVSQLFVRVRFSSPFWCNIQNHESRLI